MRQFIAFVGPGVVLLVLSLIGLTLSVSAQDGVQRPPSVRMVDEDLASLRSQINELRWDIDDLKIATRPQDEKTDPLDVEVSADYPKWRLPYGVKIDDQRPPEVVAEDIERCKAGKGIVYMWLSVELPNGREQRSYFGKVDWRDPAKKETP